MLLITRKLRCESTHRHLETPGYKIGVLATPHALDQLAKGPGNLTAHAQWIVLVNVVQVVVVSEVFSDRWTVGKTLKYAYIKLQ